MSLYWSGDFYTHWECNTQSVDPITILATPTMTGYGEVSTQYLGAGFSAPGTAPPTASPSGDTSKGGGSNSSSNIGAIVGAISGVVAALASLGVCWCTKRHFRKQRQYEIQRDQGVAHRRDLMVSGNRDMMNVAGEIERGRPVNVYVNELHYHNHGGRGGPLRLDG